ncbi:hypothetical protein RIN58_12640 [Siccibacter colletis]|uniref:hypothetical protein n=1 Tax=Siccibacter colletis TaxID=1505757 RepID=UPI0028BE0C75|nr:hypothetical protein [Siccibacter colletis]WNN47261.1 hypothetical protein RIN58_12640 [Siccibacter colletis]
MKLILFLLLIMIIPVSYAESCNIGETLVASCNLPGKVKRSASFCASDNHEIRYYFKRNNSLELQVDFHNKRKLKRWIDLGTYTVYLGFNNGIYSYVIGIPEEKPGAVAFMEVKKNGKAISSYNCLSNSFGKKEIEDESIENVEDSSVRDNGFIFP